MDALTTAALESLNKEILPKLVAKLAALGKLAADARMPEDELAYLTKEARELLGLMEAWMGGGEDTSIQTAPVATAEAAPVDGEMSDDDAMALLAMEGASDIQDVGISGNKSVAESLSLDNIEGQGDAKAGDGEMSDEEARMLLEGMDAPVAAPAGQASEGEMSDDEARMLLDAMDAPVAAPAAAANDGEMSDDEARKLLEAMDAPAPAAGGDMSDDEARKLLEAMDAPVAAPAATASVAPASISADDEALAMLKMMGGAEDDGPAPVAAAPAPKAAPSATHAHDEPEEEGGEALSEIEEFSKNDFASDPDMMNDFLTNTDELMETLDKTVLQLEQNPRDKETIESIFRAAHTLKGAAGMFGFKAMERVMHRMENLFDLVRKGTLVPGADTIDVLFQGLDVLRVLLEAVRNGKPSGSKTVPIVRALELAAKGKYVKGSAKAAPLAAPAAASAGASTAAPAGDDRKHGGGGGGGGEGAKKAPSAEQSTIRVDLERLDMLVNLVGELVIDRTRFASIEEEIRTSHPQAKVAGNMTETVQLFGRHMNEIHEIIMKIRMVPIGNAFNKFTRIIRDLSRQLEKDIELHIDGEDTELDKTLVEQIGDPLIHLIRNSCDHGIEMPDVRAAAGKAKTGKIFLGARQEGNNIIITIQDDGKGIPVDIIRKKGIERGLISEEAVLSKRDIFNLIFEPGFSTAEKVTTISGRGVGMDVVRKQISKLKGLIDIDSEVGKGTTTTIRLPLTLAIVQSLLVESLGETFAIPLSTVVESVRIKPEDVQRVGDTEVIKRHGRVLPLMHLHDTLDLGAKADVSWYSGYRRQGEDDAALVTRARRTDRLYVVIVGSGDHRFGIVVDQLLNQQEMVIKSMGPVMKGVPCVAGGAVLGNGEVVLVLDIQELEDRFRSRGRGKVA